MRPTGSAPFRDSLVDSTPDDDELPPFEDTWEWYWMRILLWFTFIRSLPWSAPRIVNDYVMETAGRDFRGGKKSMKPATRESWYKPRTNPQDVEKPVISAPIVFLPATSQSPGAYHRSAFTQHIPMPTPYSEAATAIRPTRTPMTVTSAAMDFPSPGASSHGQGRQAMSYSWYSTSAQDYPWQPSHLFSPQTSTPQTTGDYFRRR